MSSTPRHSPPRTYRRFYEALRELPGMTDAAAFQDGLRVIFGKLVRRARGGEEGPNGGRTVHEAPDAVVREVSRLFDDWNWGTTIPGGDLLGYLFERSLARKALGAYYTPPDVASYISRSVIIPRLVDLAELTLNLRALAGLEGVDRYLPSDLLTPQLLPLETARERQERQFRLAGLRTDFAEGRIATINDCVTRNLDLSRVLADVIERHPNLDAVHRLQRALHSLRVCDPTCGTGDFLLAAFDVLLPLHQVCRRRLGEPADTAADASHLLHHTLHGQDLQPGAVEVCRMRLHLRAAVSSQQSAVSSQRPEDSTPHSPPLTKGGPGGMIPLPQPTSSDPLLRLSSIHVADVLSAGPQPRGAEPFDAVIGNPPYVDRHERRDHLARLGYRTAWCGNLYAPVVERALGLLAPGGRLGMVVPVSSVSGEEYRPLAELLMQGTAWVSTFSNRPAKLFEGVEQRLAIWLAAPAETAALFTTAYQHWYAEERPTLFSRLAYHAASVWPVNGMPVKSGCALAKKVFAKIASQPFTLAALVGEGDAAVWLHDGPTYWVRALSFEPNLGRKSRLSAHYQRLSVSNQEMARVLAAVLSSSTFYFFFKLTSNCRDLGRREWSRFPISVLSPDQQRRLAELGEQLECVLRAGARVRERVYPSGAVEYEEYFPAKAKPILNAIDRVLATQYGFTDQELEYILQCDLKYRHGEGDDG